MKYLYHVIMTSFLKIFYFIFELDMTCDFIRIELKHSKDKHSNS